MYFSYYIHTIYKCCSGLYDNKPMLSYLIICINICCWYYNTYNYILYMRVKTYLIYKHKTITCYLYICLYKIPI